MLCSTLCFTSLHDCQIGVCEMGVGGVGASLLYFHLSAISRGWARDGGILKSSICTIFANYTNNTRAVITISTKIDGKGLGRLVSTSCTKGHSLAGALQIHNFQQFERERGVLKTPFPSFPPGSPAFI